MVKRFVGLTASIRMQAVGAAAFAAAVALLVAIPALVRRTPSLPIVYALPLAGIPNGVALDTGADRAIVSAYNVAAFSNGSGLGSVALYDLRTGRLVRALTAFSQNVEATLDTPLRRAVVTDSSGLVTILDSTTGRRVASVEAGGDPTFLDVDERRGRALLTNPPGDSVDVLDLRAGRVMRTIYLGLQATPGDVRIDESSGNALVDENGTHRVSVIDVTSGRVLNSVAAALYPLALDKRRGRAFVTAAHGTLVLDMRTGRVLRTITVQSNSGAPHLAAVDETTGHLFISGPLGISTVDPASGRVVRTVAQQGTVLAIANGRVYLGRQGGLNILDAGSGALVGTIDTGTTPDAVAVSKRFGRIVVSASGAIDPSSGASGDATVSIVAMRSGSVLWSGSIGVGQIALTVDQQTGRAVVVSSGGSVKTIDALHVLPSWLRWLPGLPTPAPAAQDVPGRLTVLDLSR